ncbi:MAG: YgfZ/GcvT domain-containing protein [Solirubrobacterales bacterium]
MESPAPEIDAEYRQAREEACWAPLDRSWIEVSGPDAAEYLQSQLTNEIEAIEEGRSAYAALLDRKGRIQADMRVSRTGETEFLIDTEPEAAAALARHLDTYRIGRDVDCGVVERAAVALLGPALGSMLALPRGGEGATGPVTVGGRDCLAISTPWGADLVFEAGALAEVESGLTELGAEPVSEATTEILRVEAGRPRLGREIGEKTMPAEAGILDRAVSFEKGCYIGQEPVARLHYKGSPNRFLRGLRFSGRVLPDAVLTDGERDLGAVGTAVLSPAEGWIGLAIVRREAGPGTVIEAGSPDGPVRAEVVELPFPAGSEVVS